ncbi:arginine-tRNA-protein transferase [Xylariaceae sp. FL0594]|nr:arginine-tRNA-protein transferase [Xylariaceae sp. FL0594]
MQANPGDPSHDEPSFITPLGYMRSHSCGYCHGSGNGRFAKRRSYFARSNSISAACYQQLVDRCWRRSGNLLYRPNQKDACCPHYSLRVDSTRFRATKDQRQAVNRFNRFVIGDEYAKEAARRYPKSREETRRREAEFNLVERIHESECEVLRQPPRPAHSLVVTLERDVFTEEKFRIFEDYQRIVHKEDPSEISRDGFRRFLCDSPLRRKTVVLPDGREKRLGSYHQCYRLDGKLVAIGVLDLLPDAVSAVYFLYDQSIHSWSPGKIGALRELALALEGGYRWWYPGYYIHTCPKMRYKMDYLPQEILNPNNMEWIQVSKDLVSRFDRYGYLQFPVADESVKASSYAGQLDAPMDEEDEPEGDVDDGNDGDDGDDGDDLSLFQSNMPGLPSMSEVTLYNYGGIPVQLRGGRISAEALFGGWGDENLATGNGPKAQLAQLAAAVGLDLMPHLCLDLRKV